MTVEIGLLGEITVRVNGRWVDPGPARQRCVLAALAVEAGRALPVDRLARQVWGQTPPRRPRETLHSYISRLRQALTDTGADSGADSGADAGHGTDAVTVVRRSGGYVLASERPVVDLHRFRDLCARARAAAGDDERAEALLAEAVALWRGEALTGVDGEWAAAERDRLRLERLDAEGDLVDVRLRLGAGEELVAPMAARTGEHPSDERMAAQYMHALYRAGRAADALAHYRRLRQRLVEELGTDPGEALRQLHQRILTEDPALTATRAGTATTPVAVPRQLPAAPAPFVGRHHELDRLDDILRDTSHTAATVVISAIVGAGGIGKTWLALHWAHRNAHRFPDGQLFVDLRGFSPDSQPLNPTTAVRGFLGALGVDPGRLPADPDAQAALYRSVVAGKRMLVTLDNAASVDQVLPLLPGSPTCTVLVTGRRKLASLIDRHGARHLQLGILSPEEARSLLTERLGREPVAAEPDAVDELVALCGRHPLALSITARHAATRPQVSQAELTAELRDLGLDMLDDDDPTASLPAVLSWSLRGLTSEQRTVFALLGIAPGPDIDLPAATSLTGLTETRTRNALRTLEDASLLDRHAHGRYSMHDLVRAYAATTAGDDLPASVRLAALERVVDFYLHTAHTAGHHLYPHRGAIRLDPPTAGNHPHPLPDQPAALAWMDTHHPHLLAAQRIAAHHRRHQAVWQLAWNLGPFHQSRGDRHDYLAVCQAAVEATAHLPDPAVRMVAHRFLGRAHAALGQLEQALGSLHQSLSLAEQHHDSTQQALTHFGLARVWGQRGDHQRALGYARHALDHARALHQPAWEADALNAVGWQLACLGDYDIAREHCEAALALQRHHHHPHGEANTLDSLGYIANRTGHHQQAIDHYQQALTLFRALGHTSEAVKTLDRLGHPHAALGQHAQARAAWQEALELYRQQGRDTDAERVQRQLDELDSTTDNVADETREPS